MDDSMVFKAIEKVLLNDNRLKENDILTHNVDISPLIEGKHIDLLWNVTDMGVKKDVLIEIKDRSDIIEGIIIDNFYKSLPIKSFENKCAILVYTSKLSEEALRIASNKNILTVKVKEPDAEDWKDKVREIHIHMKMISPSFKNFKINVDVNKTRELLEKANKTEFKFNFSGKAADIIFSDKYNEAKISLDRILEQYETNIELIDNEYKDHVIKEFDEVLYLSSEIGLIPVKSIEFDREIHKYSHPIIVDSSKNMGFAIGFSIVREVITKHIPILKVSRL